MTKEDSSETYSQEDCRHSPGYSAVRVHAVTAAPMPTDCEFTFFDPNEPSCQLMLSDPRTQAGHLFAILRQWVPQVQQSVDIIGQEILQRGCNVDDRDGLTDMTLLHFTCKAGAPGVGDQARATCFAAHLLELGADVNARSRWTNMNALHYAAYFDVPEIIQLIIKTAGLTVLDSTCGDFDFGTALHIASANLCLSAVECLLKNGANSMFKNVQGLLPWDVVPNPADLPLEMSDMALVAREMRSLLAAAMPKAISVADHSGIPEAEASRGDEEVKTELTPGQRITISGRKSGVLRFVGSTQFSSGQWAGIELDQPIGKHDGSVRSVRYFRCPPNHGIFVPLVKISKKSEAQSCPGKGAVNKSASASPGLLAVQRPRAASVSSATPEEPKLELGERVVVAGHRVGVIRFHGNTEFAPGFWYGVELDEPLGKNDGSVSGVRYFHCPSKHGLFAPPSRVHRLTKSAKSLSGEMGNKAPHFSGIQRSLSTPTPRKTSRLVKPQNSFSKSSDHQRPSLGPAASTGPVLPPSNKGLPKLKEGMQVMLAGSGEIGTVRFVGTVDFALGTWLGIELRGPRGRNNGKVADRKYFDCRPKYGLMVRPGRVSYHGINGAKLLPGDAGMRPSS